MAGEEMRAFVTGRDREVTLQETQNGVVAGVNLSLIGTPHLNPAKDQNRAKDVDDPMEPLQERDAGENHDRPHHYGAENTPKEDTVLIDRRHLEVTEEQRKNED